MLRDKAVAQHLDALPSHFFNDGRIIQEPPAAKGQKVAELASVNAEFMLVFAAKNADQEAVVGELNTKVLNGPQIRLPYPVACQFNGRIHLVTDADHHRKRYVSLAPGG